MDLSSFIRPKTGLQINEFVAGVYAWMAFALTLTATASVITASSFTLVQIIFSNMWIFYGLIITELLLVVFLTFMINKISPFAAAISFIVYSILNGLTLSVIFLTFTAASIASTFFITAGTFAVMSIYGYTTKRDLTQIGNMLFMALIGFIIATIVNIFLQNTIFYWVLTYLGILIFVGLTAYDTQKIKNIGYSVYQADQRKKLSVIAALALYLDFINLFLLFLRLFGRRK